MDNQEEVITENTQEQTTEQTNEQASTTDENSNVEETKENSLGDGVQTEETKTEDTEVNEDFGRPETYDFKEVKMPEGMELDTSMTGKFTDYASKLNLSQKSANEIMSMAVELTKQTQEQTAAALAKQQSDKIESYKVLLNQDSEIGGAKLKESLNTANLAYDEFFQDEELRVMLAESGMNVNPKFIKALRNIGLHMKEDTIHTTGTQASDQISREDALFTTMK